MRAHRDSNTTITPPLVQQSAARTVYTRCSSTNDQKSATLGSRRVRAHQDVIVHAAPLLPGNRRGRGRGLSICCRPGKQRWRPWRLLPLLRVRLRMQRACKRLSCRLLLQRPCP